MDAVDIRIHSGAFKSFLLKILIGKIRATIFWIIIQSIRSKILFAVPHGLSMSHFKQNLNKVQKGGVLRHVSELKWYYSFSLTLLNGDFKNILYHLGLLDVFHQEMGRGEKKQNLNLPCILNFATDKLTF